MAQKVMKTKGKAGDFEKTLGKILKNLRASMNYNQEDIAKEIGVTFQQIQKYEGGTNRIPLHNFLKICNFLNIKPQAIIGKVQAANQTFSFGFAETEQAEFSADLFAHPETGPLIREYFKIKDPEKRKQALDILKTFQEDK